MLDTLINRIKDNDPTLTRLDLGENNFDKQAGQAIGEALKVNDTITTLDLKENHLGSKGVQAIGVVLKMNHTLTKLVLEENHLGSKGAQVIGAALKANQTLTYLNLESNEIGQKGGQAIGEALEVNHALTTLKLGYNKIDKKGAQAIGAALHVNHTLTSLDLTGNGLREQAGQAIAEALKSNHGLAKLVLGYRNYIGEQGGQAIGAALEVNQTLTDLDLSFNRLGEKAGQAIEAALKTNHTLIRLDLSSSEKLSFDGRLEQSIQQLIKNNKNLANKSLETSSPSSQSNSKWSAKKSKSRSSAAKVEQTTTPPTSENFANVGEPKIVSSSKLKSAMSTSISTNSDRDWEDVSQEIEELKKRISLLERECRNQPLQSLTGSDLEEAKKGFRDQCFDLLNQHQFQLERKEDTILISCTSSPNDGEALELLGETLTGLFDKNKVLSNCDVQDSCLHLMIRSNMMARKFENFLKESGLSFV